jgi:hypothetical protein
MLYKVVQEVEGKRISINSSTRRWDNEYKSSDEYWLRRLEYSKSKTTYPKVGLLYGFDTLRHAHSFLSLLYLPPKDYTNVEIWGATGVRSKISPCLFDYLPSNIESLEKWWEEVLAGSNIHHVVAPVGTVLFKSITLKKCVWKGRGGI